MSKPSAAPLESVELAFAWLMPPVERRRIREAVGVSRDQLARDLRCTATAVASWENGSRNPNGDLGARYGHALRLLAEMAGRRHD